MESGDKVIVAGMEYVILKIVDDEIVLGCSCCGNYVTVVDRKDVESVGQSLETDTV